MTNTVSCRPRSHQVYDDRYRNGTLPVRDSGLVPRYPALEVPELAGEDGSKGTGIGG